MVALGLGACAHRMPVPNLPPTLIACETALLTAQQAASHAGLTDAARRIVPGFPHYRTDRVLASWANEPLSAAQWDALSAQLLRLGDEARDHESARLQAAPAPEWVPCAARLRDADLQSPRRRLALAERLAVPDDYSRAQRVGGAYWLARPFLRAGIASFHADIQARFTADLDDSMVMTRYTPPAQSTASPTWDVDALGIPQLSPEQWQALAERHAPHWWVETASDDDTAAAPRRDPNGRLTTAPEAVVYWQPGITRWGAEILPSVVYTLWFPARTATGRFDPYAGPLDGVVWRVTLDAEGKPLAYDSMHPCGCYRYLYPAQTLPRQPQDDPAQERTLIPQAVDAKGPLALRIAAGDHQLIRVVPAAEASAAITVPYRLLPYRALERGWLFGPDGLVAGTERGERWWLWPSGVISPGAMRQWGRHATAFVGRAHFDDPRYLEQVFVPPSMATDQRP